MSDSSVHEASDRQLGTVGSYDAAPGSGKSKGEGDIEMARRLVAEGDQAGLDDGDLQVTSRHPRILEGQIGVVGGTHHQGGVAERHEAPSVGARHHAHHEAAARRGVVERRRHRLGQVAPTGLIAHGHRARSYQNVDERSATMVCP